MPEFELLDFDNLESPVAASELEPFLHSARERRDYHTQALGGFDSHAWQALAQALNGSETLRQQLLSTAPQLPALSETEVTELLHTLQPLLSHQGEGTLAYHLYHGLAADYFLRHYSA